MLRTTAKIFICLFLFVGVLFSALTLGSKGGVDDAVFAAGNAMSAATAVTNTTLTDSVATAGLGAVDTGRQNTTSSMAAGLNSNSSTKNQWSAVNVPIEFTSEFGEALANGRINKITFTINFGLFAYHTYGSGPTTSSSATMTSHIASPATMVANSGLGVSIGLYSGLKSGADLGGANEYTPPIVSGMIANVGAYAISNSRSGQIADANGSTWDTRYVSASTSYTDAELDNRNKATLIWNNPQLTGLSDGKTAYIEIFESLFSTNFTNSSWGIYPSRTHYYETGIKLNSISYTVEYSIPYSYSVQGSGTINETTVPSTTTLLNASANAATLKSQNIQSSSATAIPNAGYYFQSWTNAANNNQLIGTTLNYTLFDLGTQKLAYQVGGAAVSAQASFAAIGLAAYASYEYTASPQGPNISGASNSTTVSGYAVRTTDMLYKGRDGTVYTESSTKPTNVGKYYFNATVYRDNAVDATNTGGIVGEIVDYAFEITPKGLTINWTSPVYEYTGLTITYPTPTITGYIGLGQSALGLNYSISGNTAINAGNYTATVGNFADNGIVLLSNYYFLTSLTRSWAINPKQLVYQWSGSNTFTYNGFEQTYADSSLNITGYVAKDVGGLKYNLTNNSATNAGNYTAGIQIYDSDNGVVLLTNYVLPSNNTGAWVINRKALTIEWNTDTIIYNGHQQTYTSPTFEGYVNNQNGFVAIIDGTSDKGTNAGTYTVHVTGINNGGDALANNYSLPADINCYHDWTIKPTELGVTVYAGNGKVYDGNDSLASGAYTLGFDTVNSEIINTSDYNTSSGHYSSPYGGERQVIITITLLNTAKANNYTFIVNEIATKTKTFSSAEDDTATIIPQIFLLYSVTIEDKQYDGTNVGVVSSITVWDFGNNAITLIRGEDYDSTAEFAGVEIGQHSVTGTLSLISTGNMGGSYNFYDTNDGAGWGQVGVRTLSYDNFGVTGNIVKAKIYIIGATFDMKIYDGTTAAPLATVKFQNIALNDGHGNATFVLGTDYTVNYSYYSAATRGAANPANISIDIINGSGWLSEHYEFVLSGDTINDYYISGGVASMPNGGGLYYGEYYADEHIDYYGEGATGRINRLDVSIGDVFADSRVYDGTTNVYDQILDGSAKIIGAADWALGLWVGPGGTALNSDRVGFEIYEATITSANARNSEYTVRFLSRLTGDDADNYNLLGVDMVVIRITKAPITIKTTDGATIANKAYDGNIGATVTGVTFNGVVSPLVLGTDFTAVGAFDDRNQGTGKQVTVTVTLAGLANTNYEFIGTDNVYTAATGDILKRNIGLVGIVAHNREYNGSTDVLGNVVVGGGSFRTAILNDDLFFTVTGASIPSANANDNSYIVTLTIELTGADKDNYNLTSVNAVTIRIEQAEAVFIVERSKGTLTISNPDGYNVLYGVSGVAEGQTSGVFKVSDYEKYTLNIQLQGDDAINYWVRPATSSYKSIWVPIGASAGGLSILLLIIYLILRKLKEDANDKIVRKARRQQQIAYKKEQVRVTKLKETDLNMSNGSGGSESGKVVKKGSKYDDGKNVNISVVSRFDGTPIVNKDLVKRNRKW
jgi:hypothetical protein